MYQYVGRYIHTSQFDNQYFLIVLMINGVDTSTTAIESMPISQPIKPMAPSTGDDDTVDDASMYVMYDF
jgi:hypothetical protein